MIISQSITQHPLWHPLNRGCSCCRMSTSDLRMDLLSHAEIDSVPATSHFIISTQSILASVIDLITNTALAVASFASGIASLLIQFSIKFQSMGETLFAAFFVLSFLQAAVAMYQVSSNVSSKSESWTLCSDICFLPWK